MGNGSIIAETGSRVNDALRIYLLHRQGLKYVVFTPISARFQLFQGIPAPATFTLLLDDAPIDQIDQLSLNSLLAAVLDDL